MADRAWVEGFFLRRNPIIASRNAQNRNPGKAKKLKCFIANDCCAKLKITMEELRIMNKAECIYNVDEKGCRLCHHKRPSVLTKRRKTR